MHVEKHRQGRYWAAYDEEGRLLCVTLYRKGAQEVVRRLQARSPAHHRHARVAGGTNGVTSTAPTLAPSIGHCPYPVRGGGVPQSVSAPALAVRGAAARTQQRASQGPAGAVLPPVRRLAAGDRRRDLPRLWQRAGAILAAEALPSAWGSGRPYRPTASRPAGNASRTGRAAHHAESRHALWALRSHAHTSRGRRRTHHACQHHFSTAAMPLPHARCSA